MADPVIYGEWTTAVTDASVPLGSYYFQYSSSCTNQGSVSTRCNGSTASNQHYVTGEVKGNVKIILKDTDTNESRALINSNQGTAGVTLTDATHKYTLTMSSDGGYAKVTCPTCGSINYIYGSATMLFRALGTKEARIRKAPTNKSILYSNVDFDMVGIDTSNYQWQISTDGENYRNISNGEKLGSATISGVNTDTLKISSLSGKYSDLEEYKFRCELTGIINNVIYTNSVRITPDVLFTIDIDGVEHEVTDIFFGIRGKARQLKWKGQVY